MRWILSEDRPDIVGYDQDLWIDGLRQNEDDPAILLALFEGLRRALASLQASAAVKAR